MNTRFSTWVKFRILHPHNREPFVDSSENVVKWNYHNAAKENQPELKKITVDNSLLLKIREKYGVTKFEQMPGYTQAIYSAVAKCFPGFQVYACGSRVRGDYVDGATHADDTIVLQARKSAGMRARENSDYDFWVEPSAVQVNDLPTNCDRCRLRIPENEKVAIPIYG